MILRLTSAYTHTLLCEQTMEFKGVMTRSMVDALLELCSPFLKGGNSACTVAKVSDLFPQNEYRSLE